MPINPTEFLKANFCFRSFFSSSCNVFMDFESSGHDDFDSTMGINVVAVFTIVFTTRKKHVEMFFYLPGKVMMLYELVCLRWS